MLKTQQHARAAAASAQEAQFELEKVQETVRHGEDVRRLEHDMKNLLLMIHILNERGDGERIDAMLNDIESKIKVETDISIAEYGRTVCIPIERFSSYIGSDTGQSPRMPAITPTAPKRRKMYEPFNSTQDYRFLSFKRSCCMDG